MDLSRVLALLWQNAPRQQRRDAGATILRCTYVRETRSSVMLVERVMLR